MTWRRMITIALNRLRVYGSSTPVSPEDEQISIDVLNDWIDGLKTKSLSVYQQARTTWALTTASSYTIGIGAVINVARPVTPQHIAAFAWLNNNVTPPYETPLGPPLTDSQYQGIAAKTLNNTYPGGFYYDPAYDASGFGLVKPWPVVNGSGLYGVVYSAVPVDEVTDVTATILLPPGYRRWIRTALELELAPAFKVAVTEDMRTAARLAMADVMVANTRLDDLSYGRAGALFGGMAAKSNIYLGDA